MKLRQLIALSNKSYTKNHCIRMSRNGESCLHVAEGSFVQIVVAVASDWRPPFGQTCLDHASRSSPHFCGQLSLPMTLQP
jgi:hypothetical protein